MELHFGPMQGYADEVYRRWHHAIYEGVDMYYTPFIRVESRQPRHQDMVRLQRAMTDDAPTTAQVIFRDSDEFKILVDAIKQVGCNRIDLNLGCPHPMQTRKGRGAAMISNTAVLRQIADVINADRETAYTVKMRLGLENPEDWKQSIAVLNDMRLEHLTVHPRVAKQMYKGDLYSDEFAQMLRQSAHPVIYNGDILTVADLDRIADAYPQVRGMMVCRGFMARPSLAAEWREGRQWSREERVQRLLQFHHNVFAEYELMLCGETQIQQKAKAFWEYLEAEIGHKAYKAIHKATSIAKYRSAIDAIQ